MTLHSNSFAVISHLAKPQLSVSECNEIAQEINKTTPFQINKDNTLMNALPEGLKLSSWADTLDTSSIKSPNNRFIFFILIMMDSIIYATKVYRFNYT